MSRPLSIFILLAIVSNAAWLFSKQNNSHQTQATEREIQIPIEYQSLDLKPCPKSELEEEFSRSFPGQIATYQHQGGILILRQVKGATRKLHNTSTCLTASGYKLSPPILITDKKQRTWSTYQANKDDENLIIRTIILEQNGSESWPNVEAWFWNASFSPSEKTYLAISEIRKKL